MFVNKALPGSVGQQTTYSSVPTPNFFWPMQEGTGTTTTDTIASSVATLSGATWGVGSGRNSTNCLVFTTSQWAYVADPFYYDPITICFWCYPTVDAAYKVLMSKRNDTAGSSGSAEIEIYYDSAKRLSFKMWNVSEVLFVQCSNDSLTLNAWNHVAVTSAGGAGTAYGYVNGVQVGSATQTGAAQNTTAAINFGGRTSNTDARYYVGRMQDVRVYNYPLNGAEITAVYNA